MQIGLGVGVAKGGATLNAAAASDADTAVAEYSGLSASQEAAIWGFVYSLSDAGQWQHVYEVQPYVLGATNGVLGMKGNADATANGSPTFGPNGVVLNNTTQYMDVGFAPHDIAGDSGLKFGAYLHTLDADSPQLFGCRNAANTAYFYLHPRGSAQNNWNVFVGDSFFGNGTPRPTGQAETALNELVEIGGDSGDATAIHFYRGPVKQSATGDGYTAITTEHIYLNGYNNGGAYSAGPGMTCPLIYAAGEELDYDIFRSAVFQLLDALGVSNVGLTRGTVFGDSQSALSSEYGSLGGTRTVVWSDTLGSRVLDRDYAANASDYTGTLYQGWDINSHLANCLEEWAVTTPRDLTANAVFLFAGINDIQDIDGFGNTPAQVLSDVQSGIADIKADCATRGCHLYVLNVPPFGGSLFDTSGNSADNWEARELINDWLATQSDFTVVDITGIPRDPADNDAIHPDYVLSDSLHLSDTGEAWVGAKVLAAVRANGDKS